MIAVTVRPPWSQIIAETQALEALNVAPKTVENRGRPINPKHIGTHIAIHGGRTWCPLGATDPRVLQAWATFANAIHLREPNPLLAAHGDTRTGYAGPRLSPDNNLWIDRGAVVAVATLVDCHKAHTSLDGTVCCQPWGERFHNDKPAHHLVFGDVRRLRTPVPARGALGVPWTLPADVAALVEQQLAVSV